jgi:hypothetical protein
MLVADVSREYAGGTVVGQGLRAMAWTTLKMVEFPLAADFRCATRRRGPFGSWRAA